MRILTVSPFFESHGGGVEIVAGALARALAARGHESVWAAAGFDPAPSDPAVRAEPLKASDPLEARLGLPMPLVKSDGREKLRRQIIAADAIVIHDALYASSILAMRAARLARKPAVIIQHIGMIPYRNPLLRAALAAANATVTRPMLERADQAIFISDQVRAHFAGTHFRAPPMLMFNGVDSDVYTPATLDTRALLRQRLGFADDGPQLLFVGRFVEKKGVAIIKEIARWRPELTIHMAGGGPVDPTRWNLPNVRVLGRQSKLELAELYRAADALLLPSAGEGFPLVVQEAMACGLPVICGNESAAADPGAASYLRGVEIDLADPIGSSSRVLNALSDLPRAPDLAAADYAARTYDWDRNALAFEEIFRRVG